LRNLRQHVSDPWMSVAKKIFICNTTPLPRCLGNGLAVGSTGRQARFGTNKPRRSPRAEGTVVPLVQL